MKVIDKPLRWLLAWSNFRRQAGLIDFKLLRIRGGSARDAFVPVDSETALFETATAKYPSAD
jgi:hypothetical protein